MSNACVLSTEDSASISDPELLSTLATGTGYSYFEVVCMGISKLG